MTTTKGILLGDIDTINLELEACKRNLDKLLVNQNALSLDNEKYKQLVEISQLSEEIIAEQDINKKIDKLVEGLDKIIKIIQIDNRLKEFYQGIKYSRELIQISLDYRICYLNISRILFIQKTDNLGNNQDVVNYASCLYWLIDEATNLVRDCAIYFDIYSFDKFFFDKIKSIVETVIDLECKFKLNFEIGDVKIDDYVHLLSLYKKLIIWGSKNILSQLEKIEQIIEEEEKNKSLYPDLESYEYTKKQSRLFTEKLPELLSKYSNMYVHFENGEVLDADEDEEALLDRIFAKKNHKHIFVEKVTEKQNDIMGWFRQNLE